MYRSFFTALALLAVAASLRAQEMAPAPFVPQDPPPPDARDAGFPAWREAGAGGIVVVPFVLEAKRYNVVVLSAVARERADLADELARVVAACGSTLGVNDEVRNRLVATRAWQRFDSVAAGAPLVAVTIMPRQARPTKCNEPGAESLLTEFAIAIGPDTLAHPDRNASAAEVLVGGVPVRPVMVGRTLVTKLAPGGYAGPDGTHALRVYLSFDALAPQGPGAPTVQLRVWNGADSLPETIELPAVLTDQLRRELLPWRVRRLTTAQVASDALPVSLPESRDPQLREAYASYLAGAYTDASLAALARADAKRIRPEDRANARLQVGITLAALGDAAAARTVMQRAFQDDRCAWLASEVAPSIREPLDAVRPVRERCTEISMPRIVAAGIVPGLPYRHLEPNRRAAGLYPLLATASSITLWALFSSRANDIYGEYLDGFAAPQDSYRRAESARTAANIAAVAAWTSWGGSVAYAVLRERRFARRLDAWESVNAPAQRRASVGAAPTGAGLAVFFF